MKTKPTTTAPASEAKADAPLTASGTPRNEGVEGTTGKHPALYPDLEEQAPEGYFTTHDPPKYEKRAPSKQKKPH